MIDLFLDKNDPFSSTLTANGAVAASVDSHSDKVRLYQALSKFTNRPDNATRLEVYRTIFDIYTDAYTSGRVTGFIHVFTPLLAHFRDIRKGMGERKGFCELLSDLPFAADKALGKMSPIRVSFLDTYNTIFTTLVNNCGDDYFRYDDFLHITQNLVTNLVRYTIGTKIDPITDIRYALNKDDVIANNSVMTSVLVKGYKTVPVHLVKVKRGAHTIAVFVDKHKNATDPNLMAMHVPDKALLDVVEYCTSWLAGLVRIAYTKDKVSLTTPNKSVSLLGKWLPSINTSSAYTKHLALFAVNVLLGQDLVKSYADYRKTLSALRKRIDIVEHYVSTKNYAEIDYEKVPSLAHKLYRNIFATKDKEHYASYLTAVAEGKAKMNANTLSAPDLVKVARPIIDNCITCAYNRETDTTEIRLNEQRYAENKEVIDSLNAQWAALPDIPCNFLTVMDGSGSMYSHYGEKNVLSPIDIAQALALYSAEHNTFHKNTIIEFGGKTQIINPKGDTFIEKLIDLQQYNDCMNTDFIKLHATVLDLANKYKVKPENMPKYLLVISDMQFDMAFELRTAHALGLPAGVFLGSGEISTAQIRQTTTPDTPYHVVKDLYARYGYTAPQMIFWDVNASDALPIYRDDVGATICYGKSQNVLRYILEGRELTADSIIDAIIQSNRYDKFIPQGIQLHNTEDLQEDNISIAGIKAYVGNLLMEKTKRKRMQQQEKAAQQQCNKPATKRRSYKNEYRPIMQDNYRTVNPFTDEKPKKAPTVTYRKKRTFVKPTKD